MNYEFTNAGKANGEIWRLEGLLGIERSAVLFHVKAFNARIEELKKLCAKKGISTDPTAKPAAAPKIVAAVPVAPSIPAHIKTFTCAKHTDFVTADPDEACPLCFPPNSAKALTREQMRAVAACFPEFDAPNDCTDRQFFESLSAVAFRNFVRLPGMESDEALSKKHKRDPDPSNISKLVRSVRRDRIAQILKS